MPFRDYMAEALYAPKHGFYTRRDQRRRHRRETDDTVYISGIARQLARLFTRFAEAHGARLVEQGAGSGKLMRFLLASLDDELVQDLELVFVEPRLARRTRLVAVIQEFGVEGKVVGSPASLAPGPSFVVAKELIGSFPVHWCQNTPEGWQEVHVSFGTDAWSWDEGLDDPPKAVRAFLEDHASHVPEGHRYEANLQMSGWIGDVATNLDPGLVVILDRALPDPVPPGGSLKARLEGKEVSPYAAPGRMDLSSAVDLAALVAQGRQHGLGPVEAPPGLIQAAAGHLEPRILATPGALPE